MSRVTFNRERFIIQRRGRPMAALVTPEDMAYLEKRATPKGLLSALGAWADFPEIDELVEDIYRQREKAQDRSVSLDA
jgi:hypothetical protein